MCVCVCVSKKNSIFNNEITCVFIYIICVTVCVCVCVKLRKLNLKTDQLLIALHLCVNPSICVRPFKKII